MCRFKTLGMSWPPRGWDQLRHIKASEGQSVIKDPASARVYGLSYMIEPLPYSLGKKINKAIYLIEIEGWEYNIHNDSREYPILSFILQERPDDDAPKDFYISALKAMSLQLRVTERSAHRAFMAANFLMKQIANNQVPDAERILRLYKIHPLQRALYETDSTRADSLHCGLPFIRQEDSDRTGEI